MAMFSLALGHEMKKGVVILCKQKGLRLACTSADNQSLCCLLSMMLIPVSSEKCKVIQPYGELVLTLIATSYFMKFITLSVALFHVFVRNGL